MKLITWVFWVLKMPKDVFFLNLNFYCCLFSHEYLIWTCVFHEFNASMCGIWKLQTLACPCGKNRELQTAWDAPHFACQPQMPHKLCFKAAMPTTFMLTLYVTGSLRTSGNFKAQMSNVMVHDTPHLHLREVPMVDKKGDIWWLGQKLVISPKYDSTTHSGAVT